MDKKKYIIKLEDNLTLKDVLTTIQSNSKQIVYFTNKNKKLLGSMNDGDIRRLLLKGYNIKSKVKNVIPIKPTSENLKSSIFKFKIYFEQNNPAKTDKDIKKIKENNISTIYKKSFMFNNSVIFYFNNLIAFS